MLRKNFKDSSGIIVDVCSAHGIWFDRGELGMIFEFVATGALAKAERQSAERATDQRQLDAFAQNLRAARTRHYIGNGLQGSVEDLSDILLSIPDLFDT